MRVERQWVNDEFKATKSARIRTLGIDRKGCIIACGPASAACNCILNANAIPRATTAFNVNAALLCTQMLTLFSRHEGDNRKTRIGLPMTKTRENGETRFSVKFKNRKFANLFRHGPIKLTTSIANRGVDGKCKLEEFGVSYLLFILLSLGRWCRTVEC